MSESECSSNNGGVQLQQESSPNDSLPISSLPFDILVDIFDQARRDPFGDEITAWLLNLTWIYRRWRIFALDCPRLWAYVSHENSGFELEFIKRSKQAKLIVKISPRIRQDVIESLCAERHRITQLFIRSISPFSNPLFDAHMPLEVLSIRHPRRAIPIDHILRRLSSMPTLVSLHLAAALGTFSLDHPPIPKIELPNLRMMTLTNVSILRAIGLLAYLPTHRSIDLTIATSITDVTEETFLGLFNLFYKLTGGERLEERIAIHLMAIQGGRLVIERGCRGEMFVPHSFSWDDMLSLFRQLPLHQVDKVEIQDLDTSQSPPPTFWELLSQEVTLRELQMTINVISSFIQFLARDFESDGQDNDHGGLSFGSLKRLGLQTTTQKESAGSFQDWDSLLHVLRMRKEHGLTLDFLELNAVAVGSKPERFEDLVGELVLH